MNNIFHLVIALCFIGILTSAFIRWRLSPMFYIFAAIFFLIIIRI